MEHCSHTPSTFLALDPRTLILAATGGAVCFSLIQNSVLSCVCLALALILAVMGKSPLILLLKRLAVANLFILFLWATVPLTVPGERLAGLGPLSVSREGVALALSVTIRGNAILLCFIAFIADLSLPRIGSSLERLRVPGKLVFLFLFTCRYIHVIGEEWQKLQTAAKLRGFIPRTSLHTYETLGNMLGWAVINSIARSHRIYDAMLLRGFNGVFHTVTELKAARRDFFFAAIFFSVLACLLAADIYLRIYYG